MKRRNPTEDLSPTAEDRGIFKGSIVTVQLHLTPLRRETKRGDLLCIGYLQDKRIEVMFPGRRRRDARRLEEELDLFMRAQAKQAGSRGIPAPHAANLRFPVEVDGVWRVRLDEPEDDELERVYQFMAGRWKYRDTKNVDQCFGEAPIKRPTTRMPIF